LVRKSGGILRYQGFWNSYFYYICDYGDKDKRKIMNPDMYLGKTWDQIHQELYDWYKEKCRSTSFIYEEHNKKLWNIEKNK
jgi:hypothetical protein